MKNKINWMRIFGFFSFLFLLVAFDFLLLYIGAFGVFSWIDIPLHLLGGILVGMSIFLTLNYLQDIEAIGLDNMTRFVFIVSFVSLFAVSWEFFEFLLTYITGFGFQGNLNDTMADLFLGILGGVLAGFYGFLTEK